MRELPSVQHGTGEISTIILVRARASLCFKEMLSSGEGSIIWRQQILLILPSHTDGTPEWCILSGDIVFGEAIQEVTIRKFLEETG
ncbi:hypothetical protein KSC_027500 [Ktedonobacter sp. SOSP1-52]|nr:hypothetical protein KSC_027500 [Ktedonobacter sp. SOSP1-52]